MQRDGVRDVAALSMEGIWIFVNRGGLFVPPVLAHSFTCPCSVDAHAIAAGRLDGDEYEDLAATGGGSVANTIVVLRNAFVPLAGPEVSFGASTIVITPLTFPFALDIADMDKE